MLLAVLSTEYTPGRICRLEEGAAGLSSGLEYEAGSYSTTQKVVTLAGVAARYPASLCPTCDEADRSFESFREAIQIGEQPHLPVQISHSKLGTVGVWGKAAEAVSLIRAARKRGLDITADGGQRRRNRNAPSPWRGPLCQRNATGAPRAQGPEKS